MTIRTKKRALAAAACACALVVAGVAFAYFTTTGSGTGTATVGSSSAVTIHATDLLEPVPGRLVAGLVHDRQPLLGQPAGRHDHAGQHLGGRRSCDLQHGDQRRQPRFRHARGDGQSGHPIRQRPKRHSDRDPDHERHRRQPGCLPGRHADTASHQQLRVEADDGTEVEPSWLHRGAVRRSPVED